MTRCGGGLPQRHRDAGMSLIEVLVGMGLFAVLGTLLLGFALSTSRVTEDTRALTSMNERSRLVMERLTRELRQAQAIQVVKLPPATTTSVTFWTDFDGLPGEGTVADPEVLTYSWDPSTKTLTLSAKGLAGTAPVLATNVSNFSLGLRSSKWQYDANGDGRTTWQELDAAGAPVGNANGMPDGPELENIDLVEVSMTVQEGVRVQTYNTQVDLRNRS
jgi:type II secretory pathway pseudopilin PulG